MAWFLLGISGCRPGVDYTAIRISRVSKSKYKITSVHCTPRPFPLGKVLQKNAKKARTKMDAIYVSPRIVAEQ